MAPEAPPGRAPAKGWPLGLLVGVYVIVLFDVVVLGRTFVGGDPGGHHFPLLSLVRPLWTLEGGLPLWSPFAAAGQPWASNPEQAAFHPLTWLFLALPTGLAFRLQVLVPIAAAVAGGLFLGRALLLSRTAALLLAISWGFGGAVLSSVQYFPTLFAAAALPWVLGSAARVGASGRARDLAGLALAEGMLCASGEPTQILLSAPLAIVATWHAAGRAAEAGTAAGPPRPRAARLVLAGLLLGGLVAAPTLLPGALHARKTVRAGELPTEVKTLWSASPWRFGELLVPSVLGGPGRGEDAAANEERAHWRGALYPGRGGPFLESIYPGLLTTLLAGFALARRDRGSLVWGAVALVAGLVALGSHAPAWDLLRRLPLFSGTRYPEKFLVFVGLSVSIAAACGMDALERASREQLRRWAAAAAGVAVLVLVLCAVPGAAGSAPFPGRILAVYGPVQAALAALGAALLLGLGADRGRRIVPVAIVLAVGADVAFRGRGLLRTGPAEELGSLPPQAEALRSVPPRGYLFHAASQKADLWRLPGIGAPPAMARLGISTALDLDFGMTELAWSARATETILATITDDPALAAPVLRRRSIAAVLRFRPPAPTSLPEAESVPLARLLELLAVRDPQPFAFFVSATRVVRDREEWRRTVASLGEGAATTACVDAAHSRDLPERPSSGRVAFTERRPGSLRLGAAVDGPAPAFLAVNQTWAPGWRATVDGRPVPVALTDLSLSGLVVPPGRHEVVLRYRDPAVVAGLALGASGLLVCFALFFLGRRSVRAGAVSSGA